LLDELILSIAAELLGPRTPFAARQNKDRACPTETIELEVDADTARAFSATSEQDRRRLEILLYIRLRELLALPAHRVGSLKEVMDEIGRNAEARGLTPEILESLLRDE
jgi:hypothetical protein